MQKLIEFKFAQDSLSRITCIAATRSVDDMIAAGSADGSVTVFLLPRVLTPAHSPNSAPRAGNYSTFVCIPRDYNVLFFYSSVCNKFQ